MKSILVTGGAGFIGSNFIRMLLKRYESLEVINLDKLTYAGNPENLADVEDDPRYTFIHGDICDRETVSDLFGKRKPDVVVNFAAESHVDRSIGNPEDFIRTDVLGVYVLLEAAMEAGIELFVQISTDEVYGSTLAEPFKETDALQPSSPYAASKTGGDRIAHSYFVTYGLPVIVTRASNNFGPYQYPEKLIPLFVTNALENKALPVYGDGLNVRDWLWVEDHCDAVDFLIRKGKLGETYNIGGGNERTNLEITKLILKHTGKDEELITYVNDRPGHDRRYALDCAKIAELGWKPEADFEEAIEKTVQWYIRRRDWWEKIKSGEYLEYYRRQYAVAE